MEPSLRKERHLLERVGRRIFVFPTPYPSLRTIAALSSTDNMTTPLSCSRKLATFLTRCLHLTLHVTCHSLSAGFSCLRFLLVLVFGERQTAPPRRLPPPSATTVEELVKVLPRVTLPASFFRGCFGQTTVTLGFAPCSNLCVYMLGAAATRIICPSPPKFVHSPIRSPPFLPCLRIVCPSLQTEDPSRSPHNRTNYSQTGLLVPDPPDGRGLL